MFNLLSNASTMLKILKNRVKYSQDSWIENEVQ